MAAEATERCELTAALDTVDPMAEGAAPWARVRKALRSPRREARGLPLPDFLGIGAQKAGTTWLGTNLRCHPELFVSRPQELHFFDEHFDAGLAAYSGNFSDAGGRVKGEITPAYALLPAERVRFIRRVMPDVRLVFVMRNPIERAWSQAMMKLVHIPGRNLEDLSEAELLDQMSSRASRRRGDYVATLDTWQSEFPTEQLFIGFFEDVKQRPQELLSDVFDFLGVTRAVDWSAFPVEQVMRPGSKEVSPGTPPSIPPRCETFLREIYADQLAELRNRFGDRVAAWR
jgi:hypothetical protein